METTQEQGLVEEINFESMGLRVGTRLFMRPLDAEGEQRRYQVEYVGALRGKSFLVTLPLANGKGVWMPSGQGFTFHVMEGMHVYAFTSYVLRARNDPGLYVHFAWPTRIESRQVRKSYRVNLRLPVAVEGSAGRQEVLLLNLSMTGGLLQAPAGLWQDGDKLSLALPVELEEASSQLSLSAEVRNQVEKPEGMAHYGVEFAALPQNDALLLHYYIDHAIATRRTG